MVGHRDEADKALWEQLRVRAVLERYFYALDGKDRAALESCFTDDVEVQYHTGTAGQFTQTSAKTIVDYLMDNMVNYVCRTHVRGNSEVKIANDTASAVTHAVATLVKGERIVVRGIRYTDELVRISGEWRIRKRMHHPIWQHDTKMAERDVPAPALQVAAAQRANRI